MAQLAYALAPGKLTELRERLTALIPDRVPADAAYEIVLQSYLFFGYAQAIEAAKIFAICDFPRAVESSDGSAPPSYATLTERGRKLCSRIYAPNYERLVANMKSISPELAEWMVVEGYGRVLSRPGPSGEERELASIVFLVSSGHPVQLYSHVRGARNLGISREKLIAALAGVDFDSQQQEMLKVTIAKVYDE